MAANDANTAAQNFAKIVKLGVILFAITAITGLILGFVYQITLKPIAKTSLELKRKAYSVSLPEAADAEFSGVEVKSGDETPGNESAVAVEEIQAARQNGKLLGYCLNVKTKGFGGPLQVVVGITPDGHIRAISLLNHSETPGLGAKAAIPDDPKLSTPPFARQFNDNESPAFKVVKTASSAPDEIQAISGATITSAAVTNAVNKALEYWNKELKGAN